MSADQSDFLSGRTRYERVYDDRLLSQNKRGESALALVMAAAAVGALFFMVSHYSLMDKDIAYACIVFLACLVYNLRKGLLCHAVLLDEDFFKCSWKIGRPVEPVFGTKPLVRFARIMLALFVTTIFFIAMAGLVFTRLDAWFPALRYFPYTGGG